MGSSRNAPKVWACLALTLLSVAYTYLATWGLDEGFLTIGAKWSNLDWHLSCGAVFALPVLCALQPELPRQAGEAIGIIVLCAITNPVALFGPGLFMSFIPPVWVTGAVTALFLSLVMAFMLWQRLPPLRQLGMVAITGMVGGYFFILAREHAHHRGCASGGVCVPVEWVLPGYLIWQGGFVAALLLFPTRSKPADDSQA